MTVSKVNFIFTLKNTESAIINKLYIWIHD